jgi:hypothetical protein
LPAERFRCPPKIGAGLAHVSSLAGQVTYLDGTIDDLTQEVDGAPQRDS